MPALAGARETISTALGGAATVLWPTPFVRQLWCNRRPAVYCGLERALRLQIPPFTREASSPHGHHPATRPSSTQQAPFGWSG
eukprot:7452062-Alexandrium_andersonii.AAC.1